MSIKPDGEITYHALTLSQLGFNILALKMLRLKHFVEVEDITYVIKLHY